MTDSNLTNQADQPKMKMNLQDAVKQQLANKKSKLASGISNGSGLQGIKKMKSQQSNKVMNQRRRMGAK